MYKFSKILAAGILVSCCACNCSTSKNEEPGGDNGTSIPEKTGDVRAYVTTADRSKLFVEDAFDFGKAASMSPNLVKIDLSKSYQTVDGFGAAITGATSYNLMQMSQADRTAFLKHIFDRKTGLGSSLIRVSIGSSDFPAKGTEFTWCDTKGPDSDLLQNFTPHSEDADYLIPVLKEIYAINPDVKIIGSPWSAPRWMKVRDSWTSAELKEDCYQVYADYFVKWIKYMEGQGFDIYAVTPQNEPLNRGNSMSMYMGWKQQRDFIKTGLGPAFAKAGIDTKILLFDHNYNYDNKSDQLGYPLHIFADAEASRYVAGSAWHNYGGNVSELDQIIYEYPDKEIYFTEASIGEWNYSFDGCLLNDFESIFMGTLSRMGKGVTLWNLMLDDKKGPYSPANGSCKTCYGAVEISSSDYSTLNYRSHYYNIAHASKVIKPGAVRVAASDISLDGISYLVFKNTDNTVGVIILSKASAEQSLVFSIGNHTVKYSIPAKSLVSLIWQE